MPTRHYYLHGKHMGTSELTTFSARLKWYHRSYAFFCPACGEIWARCFVEGEPWAVVHTPCERCGKFSVIEVPGSLWIPLHPEFNNSLPRSLLLREFTLALKYNDSLANVNWNEKSPTSSAIFGSIKSSESSRTAPGS